MNDSILRQDSPQTPLVQSPGDEPTHVEGMTGGRSGLSILTASNFASWAFCV
jgi:hypothetical protein